MAHLSSKVKSRIYANLEKYARSGMGMAKACESLLSQPGARASERTIYLALLDGLNSGKTIGQSLGRARGVVSDLEREIVMASESGGMLEKGFAHLALYFQRVARTRRKVLRGIAYPIILVHVAIPVSIFATSLFGQLNPDAEQSTGLVQTLSAALSESGWWILTGYFLALVLFLGTFFLFKLAKESAAVDSFLNRVPLLGMARRFLALERFSQVFEIFLLSGLKMTDSLTGAGKASGSGLIRAAAAKGARAIADGGILADSIFAAPKAFPNDFARGIAAAEESGNLDGELNQWARFYSDSAGEAMDRIADWAPKIFYWLALIFVGAMIIRAGLAYRQVLNNWINFEF